MRTLSRLWMCLFLILSLHAQTSAPPKYTVISPKQGEDFLATLDQLSDQGYRVIVGGKYLILRLEATPPDTYRYARLEVNGGLAQFTNWINDQGAHGYRWLPGTGLLEKAPHPHNYQYTNAAGGALGPARGRELSFLVEDGYHPAEMVLFSHAIGGTTNQMFFERELSPSSQVQGFRFGDEVQLADAMRTGKVMEHVNQLAAKGYRFLCRYASQKGGGTAVMMMRCAKDCAGRYSYSYFDAKNTPQLERDLNQLGKDGFRVLPLSLSLPPHLVERDSVEKRSFSYRVAEARDASYLERFLNHVDQEGYAPIGYVWHVGWTADGFLVVEKENPAEKETTSALPSLQDSRRP